MSYYLEINALERNSRAILHDDSGQASQKDKTTIDEVMDSLQ